MRSFNRTEDPIYQGMPVNASPGLPLQREILDCLYSLFFYSINRWNRVLVLQFSIHCPVSRPDIGSDNQAVMTLLHSWKTSLKRLPRPIDLQYAWVREQNLGNAPHWHIVAALSGHLTYTGDYHYQQVERLWSNLIGPEEHTPGLVRPVPQHFLYRHDEPAIEKAFYHISYIAKVRSKNSPPGVRTFGRSLIQQAPATLSSPPAQPRSAP